MTSLTWEIDIGASADDVFSLLTELRDYDRWLPRSSAYHGTLKISDGPIECGTTYIEPGPFGTRFGKITKFVRPAKLNFEQPMTMTPKAFGTIGIRLFHTITPQSCSIHLVRRLELSFQGPIRIVAPLVVHAFKSENKRMMQNLKRFAENNARRNIDNDPEEIPGGR